MSGLPSTSGLMGRVRRGVNHWLYGRIETSRHGLIRFMERCCPREPGEPHRHAMARARAMMFRWLRHARPVDLWVGPEGRCRVSSMRDDYPFIAVPSSGGGAWVFACAKDGPRRLRVQTVMWAARVEFRAPPEKTG